jgi:DNA-binding beta-propeller fold protein YncE
MFRALRFAALCALLPGTAFAADLPPLVFEASIPLGNVSGRVDHLAVDLVRQRLFVAELGNDSVGVVDLKSRRLLKSLNGMSEPQGIGYVQDADALFVANGGGTVRIFGGDDLAPRGEVRLGRDADNVRVASEPARVLVGYGSGAIAVIDVGTRNVSGIRLTGHPEGFQIVPGTNFVIANVPDSKGVAVLDLKSATQKAFWPMDDLRGNFPLALGEAVNEVWVVTRSPARLVAMDVTTGARIASLPSCGDADDVFVDSRRHRIYVSCGEGFIDVWEKTGDAYRQIAHQPTRSGARTSMFVPSLDSVFLAVRATSGGPAEIRVYRVQ